MCFDAGVVFVINSSLFFQIGYGHTVTILMFASKIIFTYWHVLILIFFFSYQRHSRVLQQLRKHTGSLRLPNLASEAPTIVDCVDEKVHESLLVTASKPNSYSRLKILNRSVGSVKLVHLLKSICSKNDSFFSGYVLKSQVIF